MNDGDGEAGQVARNEFEFGGRALVALLRPHLKERADACLYL